MTEEFETAGTWWNSSNGMFSGCSLSSYAEIFVDGFEWQNIDNLDAKTYNESTLLSNTNLDSNLQTGVSNQSNL